MESNGDDHENGSNVTKEQDDPPAGNSKDSNKEDSIEDNNLEMQKVDSIERNKRKIKENDPIRGNDKKIKDEDPIHESFVEINNEDHQVNTILLSAESNLTCRQVRELFVTLMIFGRVSNTAAVFEERHPKWGKDLVGDREHDSETLRALVLLDIEIRLNEHGKTLDSFNLSPVTTELRNRLVDLGYCVQEIRPHSETHGTLPPEIIRELSYSPLRLKQIMDDSYADFNSSQNKVYDEVMGAMKSGNGRCIFVNGSGRKKIDLLNVILASVRSMDGTSIALAASSLKLASNLLLGGRTFHSLFKASLRCTPDPTLMIFKESVTAELIRRAKIIVIDEAVCLHKLYIDALDQKLREITESTEVFGNKVIVLAGDFRQCHPVIIGYDNKTEILESVINRSTLHEIPLNECEEGEPSSNEIREVLKKCCQTSSVPIPQTMCISIDIANPETSLHELIKFVFHSFEEITHECAILAPTRKCVQEINETCMKLMPGEINIKLREDENTYYTGITGQINACMSSKSIPDPPLHRLELKIGVPLILLTTINSELSSGTRLMLKGILPDLLQCTAAVGREVFIPRMWLSSGCQFPVKVSFAMTINESQGLMLKRSGVWLMKNVFRHGQLYTAASCVKRSEDIKFALVEKAHPPQYVAHNVVFEELLTSPTPSPST